MTYIYTQNPPKWTSYEWSWPSMKLHQCTTGKFFWNSLDTETPHL
jgi:hypothetical protein